MSTVETNLNLNKKISHICNTCGNEYVAYASQERKYCSMRCYGLSHDSIEKLKAMSKLPRKPRAKKVIHGGCVVCGSDVLTRKVKTCSRECANKLRSKSVMETKAMHKKPPNRKCLECGKDFYTRRASGKFCSYPCFVANDGAIRAGNESTRFRMKYGLKKDANHKIMAEKLEGAGFEVKDLSLRGCGVPDMIVWAHGAWHLVEIKNKKTSYGRKGLNKNQRAWIKGWAGGPVHIISTEEDVQKFISGDLESLQYREEVEK